jgi:putative hydrolase of HD superfamily
MSILNRGCDTMDTKAPMPATYLPANGVLPIIEVYFEVNHLKQLYSQGWLQRGISPQRCETVAEHSFGVAVLCLLLAETVLPALDTHKVMRLALLHDFGEIYAGDITPAHGVGREEKHELEQAAVKRVLQKLPNGATYVALWEEYERGDSPEARCVRQMDRLEMVLQASVYEHQALADLSEFFASVKPTLSTPPLQAILQGLEALRS